MSASILLFAVNSQKMNFNLKKVPVLKMLIMRKTLCLKRKICSYDNSIFY
jgi:hypothetical protein